MPDLLALLSAADDQQQGGSADDAADALTLLCDALADAEDDDAPLLSALRNMPSHRAERLFLPTLLQLVHVAACSPSPRLARAVCALCGASFAIAVRAAWLVAALRADGLPAAPGLAALEEGVARGALEQGAWPPPFPSLAMSCPEPSSPPPPPPRSPSPAHFRRSLELAGGGDVGAAGAGGNKGSPARPRAPALAAAPPQQRPHFDPRADPYHASLDFVSALVATGAALNRCAAGGPRAAPRRAALLKRCLASISAEVESAAQQGVGVWWPLEEGEGAGGARPLARVLRLCVNEAAVLNSRDKAPFLLVAEVQEEEEEEVRPPPVGRPPSSPSPSSPPASPPPPPPPPPKPVGRPLLLPQRDEAAASDRPPVDVAALLDAAFHGRAAEGTAAAAAVAPPPPQGRPTMHRTPTSEALCRMASEVGPGGRAAPPADVGPPLLLPAASPPPSSSFSSSWLPSWLRRRRPKQQQQNEKDKGDGPPPPPPLLSPEQLAERERAAVYGEPWSERAARLRRLSPHGRLPGWRLRGCVVKVGDDCRQEALGMQLVAEVVAAWRRGGEAEGGLGEETERKKQGGAAAVCWARPLDVVVAGPNAGLIELLPDAASVHTAKQRTTRSAAEAAAREYGAAAERAAAVAAVAAAGRAALEADARDDAAAAAAAVGDESGVVAAAPPALIQSVALPPASAPAPAAAPPPPPPPRPPGPLASHFFALYGPRASPKRAAAQRAFAGALAGYSLAAHFLAVRDRHNGNILLVGGGGGGRGGGGGAVSSSSSSASSPSSSSAARLVHIDLGFMLTNAPGGVRFEGPREAPFKLTRELLEVLDTDAETGAALVPDEEEGRDAEWEGGAGRGVSRPLEAFRAALVRGFLAARSAPTPERLERLIRSAAGQWEVTVGGGGGKSVFSPSPAQQKLAGAFPCFSGGGVDAACAGVRTRLALGGAGRGGVGEGGAVAGADAREEEEEEALAVVRHVLGLLAESMDAFASRQYDLYQRVVNGIL